MANIVGKLVFKKILNENAANKKGTKDPYFEYVPAGDLKKGKKQKMKRVQKALPPGITDHEAKVLTKVKRRAYRLDNSMSFGGVKVGWSSVIGLIPAVGDFADVLLAGMVYRTCCEIEDLPGPVKAKMVRNIIIDGAIGFVPILGDVADTFFRCNTRNAVLLEKFLDKKYNGKKDSKRRQTDRVEMRERRPDGRHDSPPEYDSHPRGSTRDRDYREPDRAATHRSKRGGRQQRNNDYEREEEPEYEYRPAPPPRPRPGY